MTKPLITLLAGGALMTLLAMPVFAQDHLYNPSYYSNPNASFFQNRHVYRVPQTDNGPNGTVIRNGRVVGQDPDPTVRSMIGRDRMEWNGGSANPW
jgi:hypothetical protein